MLASEQSGEYPRPQLVRERWASLDGDWQFAYDDEDRGRSESWFAAGSGHRFDRSIVVPFPPESPASGIGDPAFHPVVWYRRELNESDLLGWVADHDDGHLLVHFGAVDYQADVWFDGHHLLTHLGGQTPFEVDVTDLLDGRPEPHVIVVRAVDDPVDMAQPRGKQDWELTPHGIWYERTTGIWQPVWCERVPHRRIVGVTWRPKPAANSVAVDVDFTDAPGARQSVTIAFRLGDELLADVTVPATESLVTVEIPIPAMAAAPDHSRFLWSPEQPTLIDAEISLYESYDHSSPVDRVFSYFGMRDVGVREGRFMLNDEPYFVRAVMEQGYWPETHLAAPSHQALRREIELAKGLGFNTVRVHQKAEDPRFLFYADT
jgi:beta-galactosidase/beta-glucuronidase